VAISHGIATEFQFALEGFRWTDYTVTKPDENKFGLYSKRTDVITWTYPVDLMWQMCIVESLLQI
jgi:hypothetical protein